MAGEMLCATGLPKRPVSPVWPEIGIDIEILLVKYHFINDPYHSIYYQDKMWQKCKKNEIFLSFIGNNTNRSVIRYIALFWKGVILYGRAEKKITHRTETKLLF